VLSNTGAATAGAVSFHSQRSKATPSRLICSHRGRRRSGSTTV
jgi:hypothetical protein